MVYAGNDIIEVDDGGINRLSSPRTLTRRWSSLDGNLRIAEFYSVAWDGKDAKNGRIFGGAQDVGVSIQATQDNRTWDTALGPASPVQGDGGIVQYDNVNDILYYSYYSSQRLANFTRQTAAGVGPVKVEVADKGGEVLREIEEPL